MQYEAQLSQMLKFVFFENKQAQGIPMEQLMKDLSQLEKQQQQNLMEGTDLDELFGDFGGGADGAEYGDEM